VHIVRGSNHINNIQAPVWDELGSQVGDQVTIAKVDCTVQKNICSEAGIRGYPTLKYVSGSDIIDYSGSRDSAAFLSFLEKNVPTFTKK